MHKAKTAKHALINETAEATKALKLTSASGFINTGLRQLNIDSFPPYDPGKDMPDWLVAKITRHYPQKAPAIIANSEGFMAAIFSARSQPVCRTHFATTG